MSISRFRHSTGHVAKPQRQLLNITSSSALWDGSNTIACNDKYVAVPWQTFGGTAVFSHEVFGRLAPNPPIVLGQEGPIIDVKFDPFDNQRLFTASEDGSIFGWAIPANGLQSNMSSPAVELRGHNKKCGIMAFHSSAEGVLASAAVDRIVNVWDVERGTAVTSINTLPDYATGMEWNLRGSLFCLVTRDKKLRIADPRSGAVVSAVESHASARSQRCVWCKRKDTIMTFGWNESQQRQIKLWDTRNMSKAHTTVDLDQSSAAFMPVFDEDINMLFVGSKGENSIKCYELMDEGLTLSYEVVSPDPMKGMCAVPKWTLDVRRCEFNRLYQLTYNSLLTIEMLLPRKQAGVEFQEDVYPPTFADKPALTASNFFAGHDAEPQMYSLAGLFDGRSPTLVVGSNSHARKGPAVPPVVAAHETVTDVPAPKPECPLPSATKAVCPPHRAPSHGAAEKSGEADAAVGGDGAAKHVDPTADLTQREMIDKKTRMREITEKVRACHRDIEALRKALHEKEAEMLQLLDGFQSI